MEKINSFIINAIKFELQLFKHDNPHLNNVNEFIMAYGEDDNLPLFVDELGATLVENNRFYKGNESFTNEEIEDIINLLIEADWFTKGDDIDIVKIVNDVCFLYTSRIILPIITELIQEVINDFIH